MSRRAATAAFVVALGLSASAPALARTACQSPGELAAMQFRQLQIELMVAALKCDGTGYDYRGHYAVYLHNAESALATNARALRAMFVREGKGAGYIDHYLTGMSNDVQIRSQGTENYCQAAAEAFDRATRLAPQELPDYAAHAIVSPYAATPCPAAPRTAAHRHRRHHRVASQ